MMTDKDGQSAAMSLTAKVVAVSKSVHQINPIRQSSGEFVLSLDKASERVETIFNLRPARVNQNGSTLTVHLGYLFGATVSDDEGNSEQVGRVIADFVLSYKLSSDDEIEPEVLVAFGEVNGRLNTYPSWREYLNNCLIRGGFPAIAVPPFNAGQALKALESKGSPTQSAESQNTDKTTD